MTVRAVAASLLFGVVLLPRAGFAAAPRPAKVTKLDARPMLGPFAQIDDFCRSIRKAGLIDCAKTGAGARSAVGPRGVGAARIQAARLVPIRRARGSARPVDMAIAMRVAAGWFVDPGHAFERAKRTDDVRIDGAKATIKWQDGMGAGVLAVSVDREGEVHRIRGSGDATEEASTARDEWDQRYCGISPSGLPSCTDELVSGCNGSLEDSGAFAAELTPEADHLVVTIQVDNRSTCTFGRVLDAGSYDLPFAGIRHPAAGGVADFIGPFASLENHCRELQEPADGHCLMQPGRWGARVKPLGARGRVSAVRLFRVRSSMAGLPVEYCRVAVATADGWYVKQDGRTCKGDFGTGSRQAEVIALAWADGGPDPAFVITVHERHDEVAYLGEDDRHPGVDRTESESAQLCSVPASGPPACGPEWIAACQDYDRRWRKAKLTLDKGVLAARSDAKVECASGGALGDAIGSSGD